MPVFEGEVNMRYPYVVDMDDEEAAEFELLALAKDDFPDATGFTVVGLKKIKDISI